MASTRLILRLGASLTVLLVGLAALSHAFPYGKPPSQTPLLQYVALALVGCGVWACLPRLLTRPAIGRAPVVTVLLLGLAMRGAMFVSLPVLEDDSYRYLWDGAVTARGIDPYKYAPADAGQAILLIGTEPSVPSEDLIELRALADEQALNHSRINYPFVATIYPPLAQAAFAVAHTVDPFGMYGWRLVLLSADLTTFWLLLRLLKARGRNQMWASLYWWNPMVIVHGFGAGHMDLLLLPFLLSALLFAQHRKLAISSVALAGAAAVKLWPILLFPLFVRPILRRPAKLLALSALFMTVTLLALLPQLIHALRPEAGLNAYASEWRTHAFLFAILEDAVFSSFEAPGQLARVTVAVSVLALTGLLALRFADDVERLPILVLIVTASLIFLSPTGYPWYLIWVAPLLAFFPHPGLLCPTGLAPLYWLRFQLSDDAVLYQWGIVPLAFGLPLILLAQTIFKREFNDAISRHHSRAE